MFSGRFMPAGAGWRTRAVTCHLFGSSDGARKPGSCRNTAQNLKVRPVLTKRYILKTAPDGPEVLFRRLNSSVLSAAVTGFILRPSGLRRIRHTGRYARSVALGLPPARVFKSHDEDGGQSRWRRFPAPGSRLLYGARIMKPSQSLV